MLDQMKRWCDLFCTVGIEAGVLHAGRRPAVAGGLVLNYGSGGTYGGLDRLGRATG